MKKLFLTILFILILPSIARAASAAIEIDTLGATVNALEGDILLPANFVVSSVETGHSIILIWIDGPTINASARNIHFAGLTPGGFQGVAQVFNLVGEFNASDIGKIKFANIRALKNDGEGTGTKVKLSAKSATTLEDKIAPGAFAINIAESLDLFGGRKFATFIAQDKQTGVAKYEVSENYLWPSEGDWQEARSPYQIKDSFMIKKLYVRAIDQAGNARVESVSLPNRKWLLIFLAIIIAVICTVYLKRRRERQLLLSSY